MNCVGHPQIRARAPSERATRTLALLGRCHAAEQLGWPELLTCKERPKYGFVCVQNLLILTSGQLVPFQRKTSVQAKCITNEDSLQLVLPGTASDIIKHEEQ